VTLTAMLLGGGCLRRMKRDKATLRRILVADQPHPGLIRVTRWTYPKVKKRCSP
jgi:hypothetical protein